MLYLTYPDVIFNYARLVTHVIYLPTKMSESCYYDNISIHIEGLLEWGQHDRDQEIT
jgi:hypothetical protein